MNIHQHIINSIKEQLFLNDYLVLPEFGGFVLKTKGSQFSPSGTSLLPPYKTVGFNILLKQNDGILINELQNRLNCTKQDAHQHLSEFATFCKSVLQTKRRLSLSGIGFFYLDFENNICFEPEQDSNFFTESFGLSAVGIKPIQEVRKEVELQAESFKPEDRTINHTSEERPRIYNKKRLSRGLYLALFILMLSTFLVFLVSNSNVKGQLRSSIFGLDTKRNYTPLVYPEIIPTNKIESNSNFVSDDKGIALFSLNENKSVAVRVYENNDEQSQKELLSSKSSKYEIILGCFKKMKNAKRLVNKLNKDNINAIIKEKAYKGMHVVSVVGTDDKILAIEHLEKIQNLYPNAWMKVN